MIRHSQPEATCDWIESILGDDVVLVILRL